MFEFSFGGDYDDGNSWNVMVYSWQVLLKNKQEKKLFIKLFLQQVRGSVAGTRSRITKLCLFVGTKDIAF
jgi:hypothetical protein